VEFYQSRRVFFNQLQRSAFDPAQDSWVQPSLLTDLLVAASDGTDPAVANVHLHGLACVRELVSGPGAFIQPGADLNTPGIFPPVATSTLVAPAPNLPCDALTVGRGVGLPQFKVTFRDGTADGISVFVDGSSVLSLPASHVTVELLTPATDFVLEPTPATPQVTVSGFYVDADASASVSWSSRNAVSAGPGGLATFTQTQMVQSDGVDPQPATMLFERPPFAKQAVIVPDVGLVTAAAYLYLAQFVSGATRTIGLVGQGLILGGQFAEERATVPAATTHIRIIPQAVDAPVGSTISVVWLIGVR